MSQPKFFAVKPVGLPAGVVQHLAGWSLPSVYRRMNEGSLPVLPIKGHRLIDTARFEEIIGRELSLDEINKALAAHAAVIEAQQQARDAKANV